MKKILVLSDTHGNLKALDRLVDIMRESDLILFAGDGANDFNLLSDDVRQKIHAVKGNCDFGSTLEKELVIDVEDSRIFLTHGDVFAVKSTMEHLLKRAKDNNCNVVVYGHTHDKRIQEIDGITFINPGELITYAYHKTFGYLVINGRSVTATINEKFFQEYSI